MTMRATRRATAAARPVKRASQELRKQHRCQRSPVSGATSAAAAAAPTPIRGAMAAAAAAPATCHKSYAQQQHDDELAEPGDVEVKAVRCPGSDRGQWFLSH